MIDSLENRIATKNGMAYLYYKLGNPQTETKLDANYAGIQNLNNFTGYTWDETLGLYFAQNRFYDAETHRFTQEDPIKDSANWYAYCENNPGVNVDVWGLDTYYFYDPNTWKSGEAKENAELWEVVLEAEYDTTAHLVPVFNLSELENEWDKMDDSETPVECVIMTFHSNPDGFEIDGTGYDKSAFSTLSIKNIDLLIYFGCNAGHLAYQDNVATTFASNPNIGNVIASDGTVYHYWGWDSMWNQKVDSQGDKIWKNWEDAAKQSGNYYDIGIACLGERTQNGGVLLINMV